MVSQHLLLAAWSSMVKKAETGLLLGTVVSMSAWPAGARMVEPAGAAYGQGVGAGSAPVQSASKYVCQSPSVLPFRRLLK